MAKLCQNTYSFSFNSFSRFRACKGVRVYTGVARRVRRTSSSPKAARET